MEDDASHSPHHNVDPSSLEQWIKTDTNKPRNIGPTTIAWITKFQRNMFLLSNGLKVNGDTKTKWSVGSLDMLKSAIRFGASGIATKISKIVNVVDPQTFEGPLPRCKGIATGANDVCGTFEVNVGFMNKYLQMKPDGVSSEEQMRGDSDLHPCIPKWGNDR